MNYLYKLVTTKNVEINYDAFKKKELIECLATMRDIYFSLKQENKQLKDNWNKLKKDLELVVDYGLGDESSKWDKIYGEYAKSTLKFMQELERSDNK